MDDALSILFATKISRNCFARALGFRNAHSGRWLETHGQWCGGGAVACGFPLLRRASRRDETGPSMLPYPPVPWRIGGRHERPSASALRQRSHASRRLSSRATKHSHARNRTSAQPGCHNRVALVAIRNLQLSS